MGTTELRLAPPRRDSRIAQVESLSLKEKPLADMTDAELKECLRYFRLDCLMETASRQSEEQEEREIAELLASFS